MVPLPKSLKGSDIGFENDEPILLIEHPTEQQKKDFEFLKKWMDKDKEDKTFPPLD